MHSSRTLPTPSILHAKAQQILLLEKRSICSGFLRKFPLLGLRGNPTIHTWSLHRHLRSKRLESVSSFRTFKGCPDLLCKPRNDFQSRTNLLGRFEATQCSKQPSIRAKICSPLEKQLFESQELNTLRRPKLTCSNPPHVGRQSGKPRPTFLSRSHEILNERLHTKGPWRPRRTFPRLPPPPLLPPTPNPDERRLTSTVVQMDLSSDSTFSR